MSWENKRYRVVYYSNTEATTRWVEIEKNPYLPLNMQGEVIDKAILDAADSVPKDWLFANVYTEKDRCVYRYLHHSSACYELGELFDITKSNPK